MKKKILNVWTIGLAFALMTGIIFKGFFPFIYLAMGTVVAMGLTVIGFILDLIARSSKGIRVTGFIFFFFLIASLTSLARMKISENTSTRIGDKVIHALYDYKQQRGHFPKDINELSINNEIKNAFHKDQEYWTDSTMQEFKINGWSDGWNIKTFRSSDSTWILKD